MFHVEHFCACRACEVRNECIVPCGTIRLGCQSNREKDVPRGTSSVGLSVSKFEEAVIELGVASASQVFHVEQVTFGPMNRQFLYSFAHVRSLRCLDFRAYLCSH